MCHHERTDVAEWTELRETEDEETPEELDADEDPVPADD
jgi:hypothetical protein